MRSVVRLTILMLVVSLPLACEPITGPGAAAVPPMRANSHVARSACAVGCPRTHEPACAIARAACITAGAIGLAVRVTAESFVRAERRLLPPARRP